MGIGRQYTKKKSKISGVMDFSQPSTLGFRTRAAKNLALLRLLSHSPSHSAAPDADSFRYLQLRNRRLEKPQSLIESRKQPKHHGESRNPRSKLAPAKSDAPPIGENNSLDCESGDRSTRESTPCNLGTDSEAAILTIPSHEIEEFFAIAEQQQQRLYTEKYNFDFVTDSPLLGRYEWVKILQ